MEPLKLTGPQLQTQMIKNGKSLRESAKTLGITIEELQSYFEYEMIEGDMLLDLLGKLKMWLIIEDPYRITSLAFKQFGIYEQRIELLKTIVSTAKDYVNQTKDISEAFTKGMSEIGNHVKKLCEMLEIEKAELFQNQFLLDFNKLDENLKNRSEELKNSFHSFNELFKGF